MGRAGASRAEPQCGCAGHVRILAGVPAIGCDVTSGVSGESREGERESEQAAGSRRAGKQHGGREGASERAVSEPARAVASESSRVSSRPSDPLPGAHRASGLQRSGHGPARPWPRC